MSCSDERVQNVRILGAGMKIKYEGCAVIAVLVWMAIVMGVSPLVVGFENARIVSFIAAVVAIVSGGLIVSVFSND